MWKWFIPHLNCNCNFFFLQFINFRENNHISMHNGFSSMKFLCETFKTFQLIDFMYSICAVVYKWIFISWFFISLNGCHSFFEKSVQKLFALYSGTLHFNAEKKYIYIREAKFSVLHYIQLVHNCICIYLCEMMWVLTFVTMERKIQ